MGFLYVASGPLVRSSYKAGGRKTCGPWTDCVCVRVRTGHMSLSYPFTASLLTLRCCCCVSSSSASAEFFLKGMINKRKRAAAASAAASPQ